MAYDDDDDYTGTRDWRDLVMLNSILERYAGQARQLTIPQLAELVNRVHSGAKGRANTEVTVAEVSQTLREAGFANVPIGVVDQVVLAAAALPPDVEAADNITLAQARRIIRGGEV